MLPACKVVTSWGRVFSWSREVLLPLTSLYPSHVWELTVWVSPWDNILMKGTHYMILGLLATVLIGTGLGADDSSESPVMRPTTPAAAVVEVAAPQGSAVEDPAVEPLPAAQLDTSAFAEPEPVYESERECHASYSGCLDPYASDYDCAGGSGNGPRYTGTVRVFGPDVFGLDRDGDGWGCE